MLRNPERKTNSPVIAGSKENTRVPPPALQNTYTPALSTAKVIAMLSALSAAGTTSYYNFVSGTMITLFVVALVVIFVYEYEVLRRPKNQT